MKAKIIASPILWEGVTVQKHFVPDNVATFLDKHCLTACVYTLENSQNSLLDWCDVPESTLESLSNYGEVVINYESGQLTYLQSDLPSNIHVDIAALETCYDSDSDPMPLQQKLSELINQEKSILITLISDISPSAHTIAVKNINGELTMFDPSPNREASGIHTIYTGVITENGTMQFDSGVKASLENYLKNTYAANSCDYAILAHAFPNDRQNNID